MVVAAVVWHSEGRYNVIYCLTGIEFQFCDMKVLEMDGGDD